MSAGYMRRCAGKDRHENRETAGAARKKLSASTKLPIEKFSIYLCEQCLGWHVGRAGHTFQTRTRRSGKRASKKMRGEAVSTVDKKWRISTVRKDWTGGGPWDLGYQGFTRHDAQREARRLNREYPDYNHEAVHLTWPRKRT